MTALHEQTAAELAARLAHKEVSSAEVTEAFIDRAAAAEPDVGAFLHRDGEFALAQARASDGRRAAGEALGPLDGVPVAMKDIIAVEGQPLTAGSRILEKFVSPYDATVTSRLKAAGAVLWGRTNLDEFAMGSSTENSAFQETRNPWAADRTTGGSSGGSAACVAYGGAPLALGSDTGGSVRQPAAFCGVVGMKPTYGLVSRYGLAAYASSLDQIGPFARTVEDAALLLGAVAGYDPRDSTSYPAEVPDYGEALRTMADRPRVLGLPKEYLGHGLDPEVRAAVEAAAEFYRSAGCELVEVSLPHTEYAVPVYYIIAPAEASSNLARYDGVRYTHRSGRASDHVDLYFTSRGEGFGQEVKRRIILGTYVLSTGYYDAYYLRAQKVRTLVRNDFLTAFEKVDAILAPTAPTPAFKLGEKTADPLEMYLGDIFTLPVNLAGLPALSLPCGFTTGGLPVGLQLIGKPFQEADLLAAAHQFERAHDFAGRRPPAV